MAEEAQTETVAKEEENTFSLPKRGEPGSKIRVVPVNRERRGLPAHHAAAHSFGDSFKEYGVPRREHKPGYYHNPLTKEEQEFFEDPKRSRMDLHPGDLDVTKGFPNNLDDNFWTNFKVRLRKDEPRVLDLSDPIDYLVYKVLRLNTDAIAPNGDEKYEKMTYMFALQSINYEEESEAEEADRELQAYEKISEIRKSNKKMLQFLKVYGKNVPEDWTPNFLLNQTRRAAKEAPLEVLDILEDEDFDYRVIIEDAFDAGELQKTIDGYERKNGQILAETYTELIDVLKSNRYADVLHELKVAIKKWRGETIQAPETSGKTKADQADEQVREETGQGESDESTEDEDSEEEDSKEENDQKSNRSKGNSKGSSNSKGGGKGNKNNG